MQFLKPVFVDAAAQAKARFESMAQSYQAKASSDSSAAYTAEVLATMARQAGVLGDTAGGIEFNLSPYTVGVSGEEPQASHECYRCYINYPTSEQFQLVTTVPQPWVSPANSMITDYLQNRVFNPPDLEPGTYHCGRWQENLLAMVFSAPDAVAGQGHIAFAFQTPTVWRSAVIGADDTHCWWMASVDGVNSHDPTPPFSTPGFLLQANVPDPRSYFANLGYQSYKLLKVADANWESAVFAVKLVGNRGYSLAGANCMDGAYYTLQHYGAELPQPAQHWAPNDWYQAIPGPALGLGVSPDVAQH